MKGGTSVVLPVKFSNLFTVELGEWLGGFYRYALPLLPRYTLGVTQIHCKDVGGGGGSIFPTGYGYFEQLFLNHHAYSIP